MSGLTTIAVRRGVRVPAALPLSAVCILPALLNAILLTEPFDQDEGVYATVAQGMLDGRLPYRDIFDHKPPLIHLWYALSFVLFGENEYAPRVMGCAALSASAYLLHATMLRLWTDRGAMAGTLAFGAGTGVAALESGANVEPFLLLTLCAALWQFVRARDHGWRARDLFVAGLLSGAAIITKQVIAWNVLVLAAFLLFERRWLASAGFAVGAAVPVVATVGFFVVVGAWDEFYYANVTFNEAYGGTASLALRIELVAQAAGVMFLVSAPLALLSIAGAVRLSRRGTRIDLLVLAWTGASVLAIGSTGRMFPHYFNLLLPSGALLVGALLANGSPWTALRPRQRRVWAGGLGAAVVVALALNLPAYAGSSAFERQEAKGAGVAAANSFENEAVGTYLRLHSTPADTVWQAGRESGMYFHANRKSPTRMIYDRPFWVHPERLEETLAELKADPPLYIADALHSVEQYDPASPVVMKIRHFIYERYEFEVRIGYADIYRLRGR